MAKRIRDNTGISVYPRGYISNPDSTSIDKYDAYIQDNISRSPKQKDTETEKIKQRNEADNNFLKEVQINNNLVVIPNMGQEDKCVCKGAKLENKEEISIKYHKEGTVKEIFVKGKICKDCRRKLVLRKLILDAYHKVES